MDEQSNLVPRDRTNGPSVEGLAVAAPFVTLDMMPREPHLYDYLMILRKHQWLIVSFLLAVVTIVAIGTYRQQPIYEATTRIEIDKENASVLPFQGSGFGAGAADEDLEEYIETQSKILTSATLAIQTVKSLNLDRDPRFGGQPANPSTLAVAAPSDGSVPTILKGLAFPNEV